MEILYEDKYLLALNKPPGLQSDRDRYGRPSAEEQVIKYLKKYNIKRKKAQHPVLLHRLDRPVSGILLFAKTPTAWKALGASFEQGQVRKTYFAIVSSPLPAQAGRLSHWLYKDQKAKKAFVAEKPGPPALFCELSYKIITQLERFFLLEIVPCTGRYHQIRAQLAAAGCPVAGDQKYDSSVLPSLEKIYLHAGQFFFQHPVTKTPVRLEASWPNEGLWTLFQGESAR